jgi:hypothetical protein
MKSSAVAVPRGASAPLEFTARKLPVMENEPTIGAASAAGAAHIAISSTATDPYETLRIRSPLGRRRRGGIARFLEM